MATEQRKQGGKRGLKRDLRPKLSVSLSPCIYAELVLMAERCDVPYGQVMDAALARFFLVRGIKLEGLWDDPELVSALAVGRVVDAPPR